MPHHDPKLISIFLFGVKIESECQERERGVEHITSRDDEASLLSGFGSEGSGGGDLSSWTELVVSVSQNTESDDTNRIASAAPIDEIGGGSSHARTLDEQRKADAAMIEQKFADLQSALGGQISSAISQALDTKTKAADVATVKQFVIEASWFHD